MFRNHDTPADTDYQKSGCCHNNFCRDSNNEVSFVHCTVNLTKSSQSPRYRSEPGFIFYCSLHCTNLLVVFMDMGLGVKVLEFWSYQYKYIGFPIYSVCEALITSEPQERFASTPLLRLSILVGYLQIWPNKIIKYIFEKVEKRLLAFFYYLKIWT